MAGTAPTTDRSPAASAPTGRPAAERAAAEQVAAERAAAERVAAERAAAERAATERTARERLAADRAAAERALAKRTLTEPPLLEPLQRDRPAHRQQEARPSGDAVSPSAAPPRDDRRAVQIEPAPSPTAPLSPSEAAPATPAPRTPGGKAETTMPEGWRDNLLRAWRGDRGPRSPLDAVDTKLFRRPAPSGDEGANAPDGTRTGAPGHGAPTEAGPAAGQETDQETDQAGQGDEADAARTRLEFPDEF